MFPSSAAFSISPNNMVYTLRGFAISNLRKFPCLQPKVLSWRPSSLLWVFAAGRLFFLLQSHSGLQPRPRVARSGDLRRGNQLSLSARNQHFLQFLVFRKEGFMIALKSKKRKRLILILTYLIANPTKQGFEKVDRKATKKIWSKIFSTLLNSAPPSQSLSQSIPLSPCQIL